MGRKSVIIFALGRQRKGSSCLGLGRPDVEDGLGTGTVKVWFLDIWRMFLRRYPPFQLASKSTFLQTRVTLNRALPMAKGTQEERRGINLHRRTNAHFNWISPSNGR